MSSFFIWRTSIYWGYFDPHTCMQECGFYFLSESNVCPHSNKLKPDIVIWWNKFNEITIKKRK